VGLALVVVEENAGAAMQLADDDALGPIDDEGAGVRHQRDLAEVDFLLLDVAHDALATLAGVVDHQLRGDLDRCGVRHTALAALLYVVLWLLQVVTDEDELTRPVEVLDGKHAAEDRLQAHLGPLVLWHVGLEELVIGRLLDVDEVRYLDHLPDTAKVLANAEVRLDDARHRYS
jgi:hypothetical protein